MCILPFCLGVWFPSFLDVRFYILLEATEHVTKTTETFVFDVILIRHVEKNATSRQF